MRLTTFAALILGLLIGICGTMALHLNRPGPDAGDWLGFAGALVGVTFTIIGTLWLESYRLSAGSRQKQSVLLETLDEIKRCVSQAASPVNTDLSIEQASATRSKLVQSLIRSFNKFDYARNYLPDRDVDAWQAIEDLYERIECDRGSLDHEIRSLEQYADSPGVLQTHINVMKEISDRLLPLVTTARQIIANARA